jgi:hypothetical protein
MKKLILLGALVALIPQTLFAYGTGVSTMPLPEKKHHLSAEFTGITSTGGGIGFQSRYTRKLTKDMTFDGGLGMSGGERTGRLFLGMDYEFFPDYRKQPRSSLKLTYENSKEFDIRRNVVAIAPTFSKGFSFWGREAYPYISFPLGLNLNTETQTYESNVSMNLGINGKIPADGYRHITGSLEAIVGFSGSSFSGIFAGLTWPIAN